MPVICCSLGHFFFFYESIQKPTEARTTTVCKHPWAACVRSVPQRSQFSSVILVMVICSSEGCLSTHGADMALRQLFKLTVMCEDLI